jgi:hypothetical protein
MCMSVTPEDVMPVISSEVIASRFTSSDHEHTVGGGVVPVSRGTRRWGTQVLPVCLPGVLAPTTWRSEVDRGTVGARGDRNVTGYADLSDGSDTSTNRVIDQMIDRVRHVIVSRQENLS